MWLLRLACSLPIVEHLVCRSLLLGLELGGVGACVGDEVVTARRQGLTLG